jgi:hypothetical protein
VWNAFGGSLPTATAVLGRWPHLAQLGAARTGWRRSPPRRVTARLSASLAAMVAEHTHAVADVSRPRGADPRRRCLSPRAEQQRFQHLVLIGGNHSTDEFYRLKGVNLLQSEHGSSLS